MRDSGLISPLHIYITVQSSDEEIQRTTELSQVMSPVLNPSSLDSMINAC